MKNLDTFCINTFSDVFNCLLDFSLRILKLKIIYKTIIFSVVLYGYETWPLTLWEECRVRVFENMILRLHNEELHSLYRSPNIVRVIKSRRLRWAGHVARMEEGRSALNILTDEPTRKRPLGRPSRRWEANIRMDYEEIGINEGKLG